MANEAFKQRLREAYQRAGGQEAVERRAKIAQTTLSYWLGPAKKLPPPDRLAELAAACDVTVEWLLTGAAPVVSGIDQKLLAVVLEEVERFLERPRRGGRRRIMIPADKAALAAKIYSFAAQRQAEDRVLKRPDNTRTVIANLLLQE
jgi:transcriptional regulator with XRE-family HTH domain